MHRNILPAYLFSTLILLCTTGEFLVAHPSPPSSAPVDALTPGHKMYRDGETREALEFFTLHALDANHPPYIVGDAIRMRAQILLFRLHKPHEALEEYKRLLSFVQSVDKSKHQKYAPNLRILEDEALAKLIYVRQELGDDEELLQQDARALLERDRVGALKRQPVLLQMADSQQRTGNYVEARQYVDMAVREMEDSPPPEASLPATYGLMMNILMKSALGENEDNAHAQLGALHDLWEHPSSHTLSAAMNLAHKSTEIAAKAQDGEELRFILSMIHRRIHAAGPTPFPSVHATSLTSIAHYTLGVARRTRDLDLADDVLERVEKILGREESEKLREAYKIDGLRGISTVGSEQGRSGRTTTAGAGVVDPQNWLWMLPIAALVLFAAFLTVIANRLRKVSSKTP